jgi:DNA topoisomerase IB
MWLLIYMRAMWPTMTLRVIAVAVHAAQNLAEQQIGVAMWVKDVLALRVGGEKSEDETDTVGYCSLRVEHLKFKTDGEPVIYLGFLGKGSIKYQQNIYLNLDLIHISRLERRILERWCRHRRNSGTS